MKIFSSYIKTAGLAFSLVFAASCAEDHSEPEKVDTLKLLISSQSILTPAQSDKYPSTYAAGLFSLDKEGNRTLLLDNQKAVYNGSKWYLDKNREIKLGTDSIHVYAYSPYDPNMQSDEWMVIHAGTTDYLYGFHDLAGRGYIHYAQPYADIKMNHALCMMRMDITPLLEQNTTVTRVYIENTDPAHPIYSTGQINMFTGETGSLHILEGEVECELVQEEKMAYLYMIPCSQAYINIHVVIDGVTRTLPVNGVDLEAGVVRNYWLDYNVEKKDLFIRVFNIEPWKTGGEMNLSTNVK